MDRQQDPVCQFLVSVHPYDTLAPDELGRVADSFQTAQFPRGGEIYTVGQALPGLFLIQTGSVEIRDQSGAQISLLGPRNSFGERGLMRDGVAVTSAFSAADTTVLMLPVGEFRRLLETQPSFAKFFDRSAPERGKSLSLATTQVSNLLTGPPITCTPDTTIRDAARQMRARNISSLAVVEDGKLRGIVTTTDLSHRAVAEAIDSALPVTTIMTPKPITLPPDALASDVLHIMHERHIGHLPIAEDGRLVGMVTQTDLTRLQAVTSAQFVSEIAHARTAAGMARTTAQIPQLLVQLVGSGNRHEVVTRLITDIADAATRRLLTLAEDKFGPPPVPYAWLACGSQGRREQTGVSDQDNCIIIDDRATPDDMAYFAKLAEFVCDGLDTCGYVYCPGDMMASNPRWCQPLRVWRDYFGTWISKPNPEAQMLASVMFDLRVIGGESALFDALQRDTLGLAAENSIFVAHMVSNSLKHTPPLGLLRGFATIRSGEHKNHIDMKHNGVVPVTDLARVYALQGRITAVNTRTRLEAAAKSNVLSKSGASDLLDAYDLIAQTRLDHQASQVRRDQKPDNYLSPTEMSDFERSHLRDAFVVVKTLQSAIGHGRGMLG
jgi:CBS domain-containing protein